MRFFSLESSKKLAEFGCLSNSDVLYHHSFGGWSLILRKDITTQDDIVAFTPLDFLSSEEYAIENCRKLWGDGDEAIDEYGTLINLECRYDCGCNPILSGDILHFNRHAMLDAPDQITFVEEYLK